MKYFLALLLSFLFGAANILAIDFNSRLIDANGDKIYDNLAERLHNARPNDQIPVIVVYSESGGYNLRLVQKVQQLSGFRPLSYSYIPALAVSLTRGKIEHLRNDPSVHHIEFDDDVRIAIQNERRAFGVENSRLQFGLTGDMDGNPLRYSRDDIVIAVIDTGIDSNHPDLRGKILYWKDLINQRPLPYDDFGHGTLVTGVATGAGDARHSGVAPGAAIVAVKAFDQNASTTRSFTLAAFDEVIRRKEEWNIRVLNCSFATNSSDGADSLSIAANRAVQAGITVVAGAGNSGPLIRTVGSPAGAQNAIAVGAGGLFGGSFFIASFSSRGPTLDGRIKPDLWAPGVNLETPKSGGGYRRATGTSVASPFVAGVAALMLNANPELTPAKIKSILQATAEKWSPGGKSNETGFGRLQAYQAITRAMNSGASNPPKIPELLTKRSEVRPGQILTEMINIESADYAMAVTAIILNFRGAFQSQPQTDLDIEITGPGGLNQKAQTTNRQETLLFGLSTPGIYKINLQSKGSLPVQYQLNISSDLAGSSQ